MDTFWDGDATGTSAVDVSANASGTWTATLPATVELLIRARGQLCQGAPNMTVSVDNSSPVTVAVTATAWTTYSIPADISAGQHTVTIAYTNDYYGTCDRNLWIDTVSTGAPPPLFVGDYESGNLSQWPVCQTKSFNDSCSNYTSGYSIQVQSSPHRQGTYSARFELRDGDIPPFGGGERTEVQGGSATGGTEGDEGWYQWSTMFSSTFPSDHASQGWGLVAQWHPDSTGGSPPVSMNVDVGNGQWGLTISRQSAPGTYVGTYAPWKTSLSPGTWQDIKMHIKWSTSDAVGFVELWYNGTQQMFTDGPCAGQTRCYARTLIPGGGGTYFKQGYYRDSAVSGTGIVYHDGFRSASTEAGLGSL